MFVHKNIRRGVVGGDVEVSSEDRSQLRNGLRSLSRERQAWDNLAELVTTEANEASDDEEKVVLLRKAIEIHAKERKDHAAAAELLEQCLKIRFLGPVGNRGMK